MGAARMERAQEMCSLVRGGGGFCAHLSVRNRTGLAVGKDVDAVERAIEDNVPAEFQSHAHHWLILHGRYVCTARKPKCQACLIADICQYEEKTA